MFSLASLRRIKEEGVYFTSHIDGHKIFMGPEESMQIQSNLGSDICMAFDECIENPAPYDYVARSVDRTYRWLVRCKAENARLNALPDTVNPQQMLWGINQGGTYADLRVAPHEAHRRPGPAGLCHRRPGRRREHADMYELIDDHRAPYAEGEDAVSHGRRDAVEYH